jgi:Tfp pilus assembly protein PilP
LVPSFAFAEEPLQTVSLENIQLLRISPSDERAVVKASDGKLKVIKVGDAIGDKGGQIIEIAEGRVVVEEKGDRETEKVIIRLEGGKQRIERIRKQGESSPPVLERRK